MLIGRTQEIKLLQEYYQRESKDLLVVYGRKGIGKTELLRTFSQNKSFLYYNARECSAREQQLSLAREWEEYYGVKAENESFDSLILAASMKVSLIIIDEFHLILKQQKDFIDSIVTALDKSEHKLLIILSSSSINWVENEMVKAMGPAAIRISAFLKVKELDFAGIVSRFPNYSVEDCIAVYGIVGGVPSYLDDWDESRSIKDNIIALFLSKEGRFYQEAENFLKTELRELALYNTVLSCLAQGNVKLNDIYKHTGFGRAKISVYIRNLIALDVVGKVFSYDTEGSSNTRKGLYRIRDPLIHFWYRFVFPNLSRIEAKQGTLVYTEKIAPSMESYTSECFSKVCQEYMILMGEYGKLGYRMERIGQWMGKTGTIDFMGTNTDGTSFAAKCRWDNEAFSEEDFETFLALLKQAEIEPDHYLLFSKSGFTSNMEVMAKGMDNLLLTTLDDL